MAWAGHKDLQIVLRLPDHLASRVRALQSGSKTHRLMASIEVLPDESATASASAAGAGAGAGAGGGAGAGDNLTDFIFVIEGEEFPALLLNLPCPVETHKTFDAKIFLKAGDVGQVLQVFDTKIEREAARRSVRKTAEYEYAPSGLTPPTGEIVKRRFENARRSETFPAWRVRQCLAEFGAFGRGGAEADASMHPTKKGGDVVEVAGGGGGGGGAGVGGEEGEEELPEVASVTVVEEVMRFEEWMIDAVTQSRRQGVTATLHNGDWSHPEAHLLLRHPELLVTEEEMEEDALLDTGEKVRKRGDGGAGGVGAAGAGTGVGAGGGAGGAGGVAGLADGGSGTLSLRRGGTEETDGMGGMGGIADGTVVGVEMDVEQGQGKQEGQEGMGGMGVMGGMGEEGGHGEEEFEEEEAEAEEEEDEEGEGQGGHWEGEPSVREAEMGVVAGGSKDVGVVAGVGAETEAGAGEYAYDGYDDDGSDEGEEEGEEGEGQREGGGKAREGEAEEGEGEGEESDAGDSDDSNAWMNEV